MYKQICKQIYTDYPTVITILNINFSFQIGLVNQSAFELHATYKKPNQVEKSRKHCTVTVKIKQTYEFEIITFTNLFQDQNQQRIRREIPSGGEGKYQELVLLFDESGIISFELNGIPSSVLPVSSKG